MASPRSLSLRSLLGASLAVCLVFPLPSIAQSDTRVCYDYQNNPDPAHKPCYAPGTKKVSHCCSTADTCVGDTLCLSQFATLYIGSCTLEGWKDNIGKAAGSEDCPKYAQHCRSRPDGGLDIGLCDFDGSWSFCCGALVGNDKCCATDRFTIGNTTDKTLLNQSGSLSSNVSVADPTSSGPASTGSANSPGQTCNGTSGTCSNNTGSLIGLGVGMGIPLLILAGLLAWENRKRRHAQALIPPQSGEFNPNPMPPEYVKHPGGQSEVYAHEAEARKPAGELQSPQVVHELR